MNVLYAQTLHKQYLFCKHFADCNPLNCFSYLMYIQKKKVIDSSSY